MKKFYKETNIKHNIDAPSGYTVTLDQKEIKTPGKRTLVLPSSKIATAVRQEWDKQDKVIYLDQMPFTKICYTTIDVVEQNREDIIQQILRYAETDLICCRANKPDDLRERQTQEWQPVLDWIEGFFKTKFLVIDSLSLQLQPETSLKNIQNWLKERSNFELTAFHRMTSLMHSIFLTIAVVENHISLEKAWYLSLLEEKYQQDKWGQTEEAQEREENNFADLKQIYQFYTLLD